MSIGFKKQFPRHIYALRHKTYVRLFSGCAPYYVVNEFPKSGGTWLAQMMSAALDVPFRRNQPIQLEESVTHGHFLSPSMLRNVVLVWRDPRDLLVSFYYHCYFVNEHNNKILVEMMKARLPFTDYQDIRKNLPEFIRFVSETPLSPRFSWPKFASVWCGQKNVVSTSYEALRANTEEELRRIVGEVGGAQITEYQASEIAEAFSFDRVKSGQPHNENGAEMSFLREGALGGWKKHFTCDSESMLEACGYHEPMAQLGYL